jgi:hypothetical protein
MVEKHAIRPILGLIPKLKQERALIQPKSKIQAHSRGRLIDIKV